MSEYQDKLKELEVAKCKECNGSGHCDDAGFGDIYYNTWTCKKCNGTGMKRKVHEQD